MEIPSVSGLFASRLGELWSSIPASFSGSFANAYAAALSGSTDSGSADGGSGDSQDLTIVPDLTAANDQAAAQTGLPKTAPTILYTAPSAMSSSSQALPLFIPKAKAANLYELGAGASSQALGVVQCAEQYVGIPYVHGGTSLTTGADCSGFVYAVYKKCGIDIPRSLYGQIKTGTAVDPKDIQPGDLLIFSHDGGKTPAHVAMYIGNGKIIEAKGVKYGVCITNLGSDWVEKKHLMAARRIVQ